MLKHAPSETTLARQVEFMNTAAKRAKGLLKYEAPPQDYVAVFKLPLFGFFPLIHTIGMKFSIDIVFCDSHKRVLDLNRDVRPGRFVMPWRYSFGGVRYLLEFSSGQARDLRLGDRLEWSDP